MFLKMGIFEPQCSCKHDSYKKTRVFQGWKFKVRTEIQGLSRNLKVFSPFFFFQAQLGLLQVGRTPVGLPPSPKKRTVCKPLLNGCYSLLQDVDESRLKYENQNNQHRHTYSLQRISPTLILFQFFFLLFTFFELSSGQIALI